MWGWVGGYWLVEVEAELECEYYWRLEDGLCEARLVVWIVDCWNMMEAKEPV